MRGEIFPGGAEDRLLVSRVNDALDFAQRTGHPKFIGFLDLHQRSVAQSVLRGAPGGCAAAFWGGFEGAERVYLGVFGPKVQPDFSTFPISALRFTWKFGEPTHRDFLGALMSIGIRREKLGDIVAGSGECTVVLDSAICDFVAQNLDRVGGSGVASAPVSPGNTEKHQNFEDISDTVASPRFDCVVAALLKLSRTQSEKLIAGGVVTIDFETETNPAAKVKEGATVSIRGHGRFVVDSIGPATRKGRLRFAARKYR